MQVARGKIIALALLTTSSNSFRFQTPQPQPSNMASPVDDSDTKRESSESHAQDDNMKEEDDDIDMDTIAAAQSTGQGADGEPMDMEDTSVRQDTDTPKRQSQSPVKKERISASPPVKDDEEMLGGDVTLKLEPGRPPKLQRTTSRKIERRPPPLFDDYEDKTPEATSTFSLLQYCTYANKYLGSTEPALECDCAEEWGKSPRQTMLEHYTTYGHRN